MEDCRREDPSAFLGADLKVARAASAGRAGRCMGFSIKEYWSGLLFPPSGDIPDPGIKSRSPALQADSLPTEL